MCEYSCMDSDVSGLLHESYVHERLKSSLAFRWPGMAAVSGRMARADGVYISLERPGLPGAGRSSGSAGGGSWLAHRSRIMLGVRDACLEHALCTAVVVAITRLLDRGTQCMSLSAATEHSKYRQGLGGTHGGVEPLAVAKHIVIVESDVVVGRRSRHRADVLGRRPQGPDSRRCHQRAAPCPLARVLAASSARRSAPSELFQPYITHVCI